jgi:hypothetical protein
MIERESKKRPNRAFEKLDSFSARLQDFFNHCKDPGLKSEFQRILNEIEIVYAHVEDHDRVPDGHRKLDRIITEGDKLIVRAINEGAIKPKKEINPLYMTEINGFMEILGDEKNEIH